MAKKQNHYGSVFVYILIFIAVASLLIYLFSNQSYIAIAAAFILISSLYIIWIEKRREKEIRKKNRQKHSKQKRENVKYNRIIMNKNYTKDYGKVIQFKEKSKDFEN